MVTAAIRNFKSQLIIYAECTLQTGHKHDKNMMLFCHAGKRIFL